MTLKNTKGYVIIESISNGDKLTQKNECSVFEKDNSVMVFYNETEESLAADVKSTLRITEKSVNLVRKGSYRANMLFEKGLKTGFRYHMPYGYIDMHLTTFGVSVKKEENSVTAKLDYELFNGSETTKNTMNITIEMRN